METENSLETSTASSWSEIEPLLKRNGNWPDGRRVELGRQAVAVAHSEFGDPDLRIARAYEFLGDAHFEMGQFSDAAEAFHQAILISNDILPTDLKVTARLVGSMGRVCEETGRTHDAISFYQQVLPMLDKLHSPSHLSHAFFHNRLADLLREKGDTPNARMHMAKFVECHERSRGAEHPLTADALNDQGVFLFSIAEYSDAVAVHQHALDIRERRFGENHPDVAQSLGNLAAAYHLQSDFERAGIYYDQALTIYEKYPDVASQDFVTVARNFADLLAQIGRTDHAREINAQVDAFEEFLNR